MFYYQQVKSNTPIWHRGCHFDVCLNRSKGVDRCGLPLKRPNILILNKWHKPKSKTLKRKIDIGPATMTEFKKWQLSCPKNETGLVFPNKSGNPLDHGYMP